MKNPEFDLLAIIAKIRKSIFLFTVPFAFLAILFDIVFIDAGIYVFIINFVNIFQLGVSLLLFFYEKISIKINYALVIYFLILNIVLSTIIGIKDEMSITFFMRDTLSIFILMSLASIVINKYQNLIIGSIYISLYCLLAFITRSQFLFTNFVWIIAVVGGFSVSMFMFMRIVELSIDKQERLTTKVLLQNKELSTQANNLEEINKLLSQQAFEIKKQQRELQRLNSTKDKFFSLVAHDLKTPMNSIIGLLQIFENKYDTLEDEKKIKYIQLIKSASVNTYALLDNLLEWSISQTKSIALSPEKIKIDSIFNQIIELLDPAAKNKKIILRADCSNELVILADEHMIVTVLRNLVSNGIKYTPENGSVVLKAEKHKNYVQISVADSGVGMSKEIIESLFKIEKASSTKGTSGEAGTGLGLIISNDFLIKHHTHLKVKSKINEGTVFYFSLPLAV